MFIFFYILFYIVNVTFADVKRHFYNDDIFPRVVNGYSAKLGDVPYQIGFKIRLRRRATCMTFCGGVIIAPSKLLSAAHCFAKDPNICQKLCGHSGSRMPLSHVYAVAGNLRNYDTFHHDSLEHGQWRKIKSMTFPKNYRFPKNDIAILYTFEPFYFNDYVNSIPIAKRYIDYGGKCLASGYGRMSSRKSASKLLLANLYLMSTYKCSMKFRKNMKRFVCTESVFTDVGKGDSGGPLVCRNTGDINEGSNGILVGIVSGNLRHVGSIFTRVSYFARYIERNKSCSVQPALILYAIFLSL